MCVIFFCADSNPQPGGYKLILASNRDEYFARATRSVSKWPNADHVYGGVDLEPGREGGTWLAISHSAGFFKVGALLNLTGEPKPRDAVAHKNILQPHNHNSNSLGINHCPSPKPTTSNNRSSHPSREHSNNEHFLLGRGMIVADYVSRTDEEHDILNYNRNLLKDCTKYTAFNFASIEIGPSTQPARVNLLSNKPPTLEEFRNGECYGFGNSLPHTPFEKVRHGRQEFETIVKEHGDSSVEMLTNNLMELLRKKHKFWPDVELKRRAPNWGEGLSSINVHIEEHAYGSRTHTVILVDSQNKMHFIEETMTGLDPNGEWSRTHIEKDFQATN
ncbi:transport and Golgi organization protein 2 isoform X1 [Drosophila ficusphila]|uniref:transport and Golgi organization protein 2 isoform X1 n=1 Tax=Drosophila ficusphila TaxID=30025 RepID=UPI0007E5D869|nr:transport and Golgi organization protein 2 isoform X1 [Drosophila ficusphila]XP_017055552.1 transport and Golgi organization protein 2 isoform X1 [Drosophila ficusphila]